MSLGLGKERSARLSMRSLTWSAKHGVQSDGFIARDGGGKGVFGHISARTIRAMKVNASPSMSPRVAKGRKPRGYGWSKSGQPHRQRKAAAGG